MLMALLKGINKEKEMLNVDCSGNSRVDTERLYQQIQINDSQLISSVLLIIGLISIHIPVRHILHTGNVK